MASYRMVMGFETKIKECGRRRVMQKMRMERYHMKSLD